MLFVLCYCDAAFSLLTTFSSTTKRSLQPHDDKLLIGGQQPLTSACIGRFCFSLLLITRTSLLVLQFSFLGSCYSYSALVEQPHLWLFLLWWQQHAMLPYNRLPQRQVLNDKFTCFYFIRWHLLSSRISREFC